MNRLVLVLLALMPLINACSDRDSEPPIGLSPEEYSKVADRMIREEDQKRTRGFATVKELMPNATKVTEHRVVSQFNADYKKFVDRPRYGSHALVAERRVSKEAAAEIATVLSDPTSYLPPGSESSCLPDPGYIVSFEVDGKQLDAVVCFTCADVWFNGVKDLEGITFAISPEAAKRLRPRAENLVGSAAAN